MAVENLRSANDAISSNSRREEASPLQAEYLNMLASSKNFGVKQESKIENPKESPSETDKKGSTSNLEERAKDLDEFLTGWEKKLDKHAREQAEKHFNKLQAPEKLAVLDYAKATRENPKKPEEGWLGYADRLKKEGVPNVDVAMKVMGNMALSIVFLSTRYSMEQKKNFTK